MNLKEYEKEILGDAISLEIIALRSALKNKSELTPETIVRFEHGFNVLSSALQQIDNYVIIEFDEEQSYHVRYSISLLLSELMSTLCADKKLTAEKIDIFKYQVDTLIDLYKKMQ